MSNATGIVSRENEGQITSANTTTQDVAGRGILRYELPLAKIIMLVFTGEVRANELRLNWLTPGLRDNVARTLCIVEPLHVNTGSGHPSCMVRTVWLSEFIGAMDNCAELFAVRNRRMLQLYNL